MKLERRRIGMRVRASVGGGRCRWGVCGIVEEGMERTRGGHRRGISMRDVKKRPGKGVGSVA